MALTKRKKIWRITAGDLQAVIDPAAGGKIRQLRSIKSKRNFFFEDPRGRLKGKSYVQHDISGFDECFPCVGKSAGKYGQDHGVLWDQGWEAYRQGRQLITRISRPHGMPVICTRVFTVKEENAIRINYTLVNLTKKSFPFIYSSHPILAVDRSSRIRLKNVKQLTTLGHNGLLKAGSQQAWPVARMKNGTTCRLDTNFSSTRKLAGKWFAKDCSEAHVTFPGTKESLVLRWDAEHLPAMGLWLSLGIPLDERIPDPQQWRCVALEPCTYAHDIIQRRTPELKRDEPYSFWIEWKLESKREAHKRLRRKMILKKIKRILPGKRKTLRRTAKKESGHGSGPKASL